MAERALWSTRLLLLVAVAGSAVASAAMLWLTVVDLGVLLADVADYTTSSHRSADRPEIIATVIKAVDGFLVAAILLVVAFGLYELFVSRLDPARRRAGLGPNLLMVRSLEDLKDRVAKLVVLVLVIEFFQRSLRVDLDDARELTLLGGGIALVSLALALPGLADRLRHRERERSPDGARHQPAAPGDGPMRCAPDGTALVAGPRRPPSGTGPVPFTNPRSYDAEPW